MPHPLRAFLVARIREIGIAEVARRVAPVWGVSPDSAQSRLSRFCSDTKRREMTTDDDFFALLDVLGLTIAPTP